MGGKRPTPRELRNEYMGMVRRGVGIFAQKWETACNKRNVGDATNLHEKEARITTLSGTTIVGRDSVRDWYKISLPRMSGCRMEYDNVTASGEMAAVTGTLRYEVTMATGGTVVERRPFQMVLRLVYEDDWRLVTQMGGDLPAVITSIAPSRADIPTGESESIGVLITDGLGHPIKNALVAFSLDAGHGTLSPLAVTTDENGRAMVRFTAGTVAEAAMIRATTSMSGESTFLKTTIVAGEPTRAMATKP